MLYAAGLGLIPIPILDAAGILGVQVVMIKDIAKIYRAPFKDHIVKSLIGSLVGSVGTIGGIKAIPGVGSVLGGVTVSFSAAAATYAIGKVFAQHFAQGGTLLDFDPVKSRAYFQEQFIEGELKAKQFNTKNIKEKSAKMLTVGKNRIKKNQQEISISSKSQKTEDPLEKARRIRALKKKRQKLIKARNRKKKIRKWIGSFVTFCILSFLVWQFYLKEKIGNSSVSTEIDLYMQEAQAKQYHLQPTGVLDSLEDAKIASYPLNSTEGVVARYIQEPDATYPKRYSLSAVRFTGSSESLSSGAREQLSNIALLMKKYPELLVNLYGHTTGVGPKFNRQRMGRERARVLKEIFEDNGIPSFRITGNYIEKAAGTHDEYWGAEIVIDVSTQESVVEVAPPTLPSPTSVVPEFVSVFRERISSEDSEEGSTEKSIEETVAEDSTNINTQVPTEPQDASELEVVSESEVVSEPEVVSDDIKEEVDTLAIDIPEVTPVPVVDTPTTVIPEEKESEQQETETQKEESLSSEPASKRAQPTTTEAVIKQYLGSPNITFPKLFLLSAVQFEGETTDMNAAAKTQIMRIAEIMQQYPKMKVDVYGHTAGVESEDQAAQLKWQNLGVQRAKEVKKILNGAGIANRRIGTKARRQRRPITSEFWSAEVVIKNK